MNLGFIHRTRLMVPLMFVFVLGFVLVAHGQQNRSSISGFVFTPDRRPVPNIPVELLNEVNSILQRVRTDNSGRYAFFGLSSGRFTVRVLTMGSNMESLPEDVEIAGVGVGGRAIPDNVQKDLYLRYKKLNTGPTPINEVVFAQDIPAQAQTLYNRGISDLEDNRNDAGVEELKEAVKIFPQYYLALQRLGLVSISQNKFDDAVNYLKQAAAVNGNSYTTWYALGFANYSLKKFDDALAACKKAVELNGASTEAYLMLGITLRQMQQFPQSEEALLRANKNANEKSADVHWNLALLYAHNLQRYKDAADHLEQFLKQSPEAPNKDAIKKLIKQFRQKAQTPS